MIPQKRKQFDQDGTEHATNHDKRARTSSSNTDEPLRNFGHTEHPSSTEASLSNTPARWMEKGSGVLFGLEPQRLLYSEAVADNMRTSKHGWKYSGGYRIPFFGVVIHHRSAWYLIFGNGCPPHNITKFQEANETLQFRFNIAISRPDRKETDSVFIHISIKESHRNDIRKPYILADLDDFLKFMNGYKEMVETREDRFNPPAIDVAFKEYLQNHPDFPHPVSYTFPKFNPEKASGSIELVSSSRTKHGTGPDHGEKLSGRNFGLLDDSVSHAATGTRVVIPPWRRNSQNTSHRLHESDGTAGLDSRRSSNFSQFHVDTPITPDRSSRRTFPPPPAPSVQYLDSEKIGHIIKQIVSADNTSYQNENSDPKLSLLPEKSAPISSPANYSREDRLAAVDPAVRGMLAQRYNFLYNTDELCALLRKDLHIFTKDTPSIVAPSHPDPLPKIELATRTALVRRYGNYLHTKKELCALLSEELGIFTTDDFA